MDHSNRRYSTSLDKYIIHGGIPSNNDNYHNHSSEFSSHNSNNSNSNSSTAENVRSKAKITTQQLKNRWRKAATTIQLISKTLEAKEIDYSRLLHYLCHEEFYIYSTHSKYTDLISICLENDATNLEARRSLKIDDIRVFTRIPKFWEAAAKIARPKRKRIVTAKFAAKGETPTSVQCRLLFSAKWRFNSKHDSCMVSCENDGEFLCTKCHFKCSDDKYDSKRSNSFKTPKQIVDLTVNSCDVHYESDEHKAAIKAAPSNAVKLHSIVYVCCI